MNQKLEQLKSVCEQLKDLNNQEAELQTTVDALRAELVLPILQDFAWELSDRTLIAKLTIDQLKALRTVLDYNTSIKLGNKFELWIDWDDAEVGLNNASV